MQDRNGLAESSGKVIWQPLQGILSEGGELLGRPKFRAESREMKEDDRLYWWQSSRKQGRDAAARQRLIERTIEELNELEDHLQSPWSRFRGRAKVQQAVPGALRARHSGGWVQVNIETQGHCGRLLSN